MQMAQNGVWKSMHITAPENYTTLGEVKNWLDSVIPSSPYIWVLKDDISQLVNSAFIGTVYVNNVNTYHFRANANSSQIASGINNTAGAEIVNANDGFTIFYQ